MKKLKLFFAALALLVGGANSASAQTDVTSTYLTNADFEGEKTIQQDLNGGDRCIYKPNGWTVTYSSGAQYDMTAMKEGDKAWNTFTTDPVCALPVNGGTQSYFMRFRWSGPTIKISQTTSSALPAGTYRVSADAYRSGGNGTATLSAGGKSVTVDTRNRWANYSVIFTLTEATSIEISLTFTGRADKAVAGVDNFKIENITQGASDLSHDWTTTIANAGFELGSPDHSANSFTEPYGYTMDQSAEGWQDGSINTTNPSEGSKLYNYWAGTTTSLDIYQRLQLPAGKYTITADLRTEAGKISNQGVYAKIGDETFKSGTITNTTDPFNSVEAWNTLSKEFYVQSDGTVQVGASSTGGASSLGWFQIDNFQLTYKGAVKNTPYSIAQGAATAITSDKWYAVTVPADGEYRIISSVDNTVYYTQNGYYAPSDAESIAVTAGVKQVVNLTAGTLYVRVANDATLTIKPDVYTYSVGAGTPSVANNGYTQSNTMTITFASAATNDPDGALSILDGSKIKVDDAVTTASIDGKVLTLTLASPVTVSSSYAVSIEAGAVGYNVDNTNEAISLTAKTPVLFDGTFFIATSDETQFISRGGNSNTEAILDEFGIAATFTTNGENVTTITFLDNNKHLAGGSQSIYNDKTDAELEAEEPGKGARAYWTITANEDGYSFYSNKWSKYIGKGAGAESPNYPTVATYTDATPYKWMLVTPAAHAAIMATYKDANAAAVATDAGLSAATVTELKTIIEGAGWVSENVAVTDAIASTQEKYQFDNSETPISENLTGLEDGIYKVKLSVFKRIAGNEDTYNLYNNNQDSPTAYLFAGDNKAQVPSVMSEYSPEAYTEGWNPNYAIDGKNFPNSKGAAGQAFYAGRYTLEVFAYVDGGSLNIGLKNPAKYANYNWLCYRDLVVTRYYPGVSATIGATGWTTFASPFALDLSSLDGATAYYASDVDGETVTMTSTDQAAVQAGEGIMLKGTANAEIIIPVVASGTNISGNLLVGCTSATDITDATPNYADIYVLGIKSETTDVAEFQNVKNYIYNDGGDSRTVSIPAGKAYLKAPALSARGLRIVIADDVTGINEAQATGVEAVVKEGKFIEKGKLFIFKNGKKYNANGQMVK